MDVEARESASVSYPASLEVSPTGAVSGSMVSATNVVVGLPPTLGDVGFGGDLGEDPLGDTSLAGLAAGSEGVSPAIIGT